MAFLVENTKNLVLEVFSKARPTLVIEFPANPGIAPTFHKERFLQIVAKGSVESLPVVVICIAGHARNGKSFLLNLMVNYLRYTVKNGNDSGWNNSKWQIKFGDFSSGRKPHTRGVWIWDHPFIVNSSTGKVALLLMDCQGLGDSDNCSPELENMIVYTALELSTVFIWNSKECFSSGDLEKLMVCAGIANIDEERALFDSIFFVIRDWEYEEAGGNRKDILEDCLKRSNSEHMNKIKRGIRNAFVTKECYALHRPGPKVLRANDTKESSLDVDAISTDSNKFVASAKTLFQAIIKHSKTTERSMLGRDLVQHFRIVGARLDTLAKDDLILTRSTDLLEDAAIARARKSAQALYENGLKELAGGSDPLDEEGLYQAVSDIAREATETFNKRTAYYQKSAFTSMYRKALDELLKTKHTDLNVVKILRRVGRYERMDIELDDAVVKELDETLKEYIERKAELNPLLENPRWYEDNLTWFRRFANMFRRLFNIE